MHDVIVALQDEEQVQDVSAGVILSGKSFVLQKINRTRSGDFYCAAENALGRTTSQPVTLKIKCEYTHAKLICLTGFSRIKPLVYYVLKQKSNV